LLLFQRKYRPLLGLDITTSSVKLIELAMAGGEYRVEAYAAEPTPQNAINEKAIVDSEAVAEAIRRAIKRSGAKSREVAIAISGDAAITKVIQMPRALRERDLESQVEMQADQYIPFPMDEVSYDFEVLDLQRKTLTQTTCSWWLPHRERRPAAGRCECGGSYLAHRRRRSLRARERVQINDAPDAGRRHRPDDRRSRFRREQHDVQRPAQPQGRLYPRFRIRRPAAHEEIMRTYGLSMEEAGRAKKEGGLPGNYQSEVLDPFTDDMTQQVSRSLQFYLASGSGREQPEKILICGGCANISGVSDVISSRVGISAERAIRLGR